MILNIFCLLIFHNFWCLFFYQGPEGQSKTDPYGSWTLVWMFINDLGKVPTPAEAKFIYKQNTRENSQWTKGTIQVQDSINLVIQG